MRYFQKQIFFSLIFIMSTNFAAAIFCAYENLLMIKEKSELLCPIERTVHLLFAPKVPSPMTPAPKSFAILRDRKAKKQETCHFLVQTTNLSRELAKIVIDYAAEKKFSDYEIEKPKTFNYSTFFPSSLFGPTYSTITVHPEASWHDFNESLKIHHLNELVLLKNDFPQANLLFLSITNTNQMRAIITFNRQIITNIEQLLKAHKSNNAGMFDMIFSSNPELPQKQKSKKKSMLTTLKEFFYKKKPLY